MDGYPSFKAPSVIRCSPEHAVVVNSCYANVMRVFRRLILVSGCALVAIGWLLPGQAAEREPVLGVFIDGKDLTPDEMVQVRRLIQPTGKAPWLIYGFRSGPGGLTTPDARSSGSTCNQTWRTGGFVAVAS